jgi:hypothetical protein
MQTTLPIKLKLKCKVVQSFQKKKFYFYSNPTRNMNFNKRINGKIDIKRIKDQKDELTDEKTLVNTHSKRLWTMEAKIFYYT